MNNVVQQIAQNKEQINRDKRRLIETKAELDTN